MCETCKPRDSDTCEDSDEEDRKVREKIEQHERRRKHLNSEKQRILNLIEDDKKRLQQSKAEYDKGLNEIKAIFADSSDEDTPGPSWQQQSSEGPSKKPPPQVFLVSNERYATNMPRRTPSSTANSSVPDVLPDTTDCDSANNILLIQDSDEDESVKVPRIETVCGGSEVKDMNLSDIVTNNSDVIEIKLSSLL